VSGRFPVAVRRRLIGVVIVLAVAELAVETWVTRDATAAGIIVPVVAVLSGLFYLWSTRRRS
jgi:hypothetical protein